MAIQIAIPSIFHQNTIPSVPPFRSIGTNSLVINHHSPPFKPKTEMELKNESINYVAMQKRLTRACSKRLHFVLDPKQKKRQLERYRRLRGVVLFFL